MRRLILASAAVVAVAGPAAACINDVELTTHEREFRSQYGRPPAPPEAAPAAAPSDSPSTPLLAVSGVVLLAAAAAVALTAGRSRG